MILINHNQPFCDKLICSQTHTFKHAVLDVPYTINYEPDGSIRKVKPGYIHDYAFEGSHSTTLRIYTDGYTVKVKGNFGVINRPDNVFGYSLDECKIIVNTILVSLDLPPFSDGEIEFIEYKNKSGVLKTTRTTTGAQFSEIHYTLNTSTGSIENQKQFIHSQSIKNVTRQKSSIYKNSSGQVTGIGFGYGSRFKSSKIYIKSLEIIHNLKEKKLPLTSYHELLIKYCESIGLIRFEVQFRNYLSKHNIAFWKEATHKSLQEHFYQEHNVMTKSTTAIDYDSISPDLLGVYFMYVNGINLREKLSRPTYYRKRKGLLAYGIDISEVLNVTMIKPKTITITCGPIPYIPDWYHLPKVEDLLK